MDSIALLGVSSPSLKCYLKAGLPFSRCVVERIAYVVQKNRLQEYDPISLYISMITQPNKRRG